MSLPNHVSEHLLSLTADQRVDVLGRLWGVVEDAGDLIAIVEALSSRGRPAIREVIAHRKELRPPRPGTTPAKTLAELRMDVAVAPDVAASWPGGGAALAELLAGAHITTGPTDVGDRVTLRRRTERQGLDVTAIAVRRRNLLYVIEATDMAATRTKERR